MAARGDLETVSLCAVGDVMANREDPESIFALAAPVLREADIAFCQLESPLSEGGTRLRHPYGLSLRAHPRNVQALTSAGFDIVSFASNHCMDWGEKAFLDTIELLRGKGMQVVGVGKNLEEARRPVILERKGIRIAFLGYNCILQFGHEADAEKPGCAPIEVTTFYQQIDAHPGTPPRIITAPDPEDLEAMRGDIAQVRPQTDVLVVSMHWGVHLLPRVIAMYQPQLGHAAIDAGADLILGHHAHILKAIEVYKGKAIFYSLGNFAFDRPPSGHAGKTQRRLRQVFRELYGAYADPDPDYPTYPFAPDARKTVVVRAIMGGKRIQKLSLLPALINRLGQPEVLKGKDPRREEVFRYLEDLCRDFGTRLSQEDDEVLIHL